MKLLRDMKEPELWALMHAVGDALASVGEAFEVEQLRYVVLVFNDPGFAQYASNCDQKDVIGAMRECANRFEGKREVPR
jgi:hypothetical protein